MFSSMQFAGMGIRTGQVITGVVITTHFIMLILRICVQFDELSLEPITYLWAMDRSDEEDDGYEVVQGHASSGVTSVSSSFTLNMLSISASPYKAVASHMDLVFIWPMNLW